MQARIALAAALAAVIIATPACAGRRSSSCGCGAAIATTAAPPAATSTAPEVVETVPAAVEVRPSSAKYDKPGFKTFEEDGRLWVFKSGSEALDEFYRSGEPAKSVTLIGSGPDGMSLRAADKAVANDYAALWPKQKAYRNVPQSPFYSRPGFAVFEVDGRLWVFQRGSENLEEFYTTGEPAKNVTLVAEGPNGKTLKGAEKDVLLSYKDAFKYGRRGFAVFGEDGRLWVFRVGSEAMDMFLEVGEPAKSVTLIGEGPDGKTVRAADTAVAKAYIAASK